MTEAEPLRLGCAAVRTCPGTARKLPVMVMRLVPSADLRVLPAQWFLTTTCRRPGPKGMWSSHQHARAERPLVVGTVCRPGRRSGGTPRSGR